MNRRILNLVISLAIIWTFAGELAPWFAPADILNHSRPYLVTAMIAVILWALVVAHLRAIVVASVVIMINATSILTPASASATLASAGNLKVLSFNVWSKNKSLPAVAEFILREDPDIVLLQETPPRHQDVLFPLLKSRFPHIFACACRNQVMLSKKPWREIEAQDATSNQPALIRATFDGASGRSYLIIGLHPAYPLTPNVQARHYEWLRNNLPSFTARQTTLVVGDFNLSPWSYQLQALMKAADLKRHGTWQQSWPAHFGIPIQAFLIDNVLSTPDVRTVTFATGPGLGSDHLPIVATVAVP